MEIYTQKLRESVWGVGTILEQGDNFAGIHERITIFKNISRWSLYFL